MNAPPPDAGSQSVRCSEREKKLALYIPNLEGGGIQQTIMLLAGELVCRGYRVDLIVDKNEGVYVDHFPPRVDLVELGRVVKTRAQLALLHAYPGHGVAFLTPVLLGRKPLNTLRRLLPLADYLKEARPVVLISAFGIQNMLAVWAAGIARVGTRTIVTEHSTLSRSLAARRQAQPKQGRRLDHELDFMHRVYPLADAIVAVSHGVADDLAVTAELARGRIITIHNPVVSSTLARRAAEPVDHGGFDVDAPPVVLAVGRLMPEKGFPTLIDAFASLRQRRIARLVIVGEGDQRTRLETQIRNLGLEADVVLPGWSTNPLAAMSRAAVFVLSSVWEGLPGVLIEAMACGCPVVATDCDSGPREIMDNGRYGTLVPVNDAQALAHAIGRTLDHPIDADTLRRRAGDFSVEKSLDRYVELIEKLIRSTTHTATKRSRLALPD